MIAQIALTGTQQDWLECPAGKTCVVTLMHIVAHTPETGNDVSIYLVPSGGPATATTAHIIGTANFIASEG